jgi:bacteriorhodopsin
MISLTQSWLWTACCAGMVIGSVIMGFNSTISKDKQRFRFALLSFFISLLTAAMYMSINVD